MRELLVMRHGKSDWDANFGSDRDRPLNRRGVQSANAVGRFLAASGRVPDIATTSSATRAETTLDLAIEAGRWRCEKRVDDSLYGSGPEGVMAAARRHGSDATRLLVVGHEPTMSSVVARIMGGGAVRFPTAAVAGFRLRISDWSKLDWATGELEFFILPRMLVAGTT